MSLRLEQEVHKRSLSQSELNMQNQQVLVMRSSEKALKQEINHLLDLKDDLESQSQELRRFRTLFYSRAKKAKRKVPLRIVGRDLKTAAAAAAVAEETDRLLVVFQGQSRYGRPAEGAQGPAGG